MKFVLLTFLVCSRKDMPPAICSRAIFYRLSIPVLDNFYRLLGSGLPGCFTCYLSWGLMSLYRAGIILDFSLSTGRICYFVLTGFFSKRRDGLTGLFSKPPPQLGHTLQRILLTQCWQKVHSKLQIIASVLLPGSALPQSSHTGFIANIFLLL